MDIDTVETWRPVVGWEGWYSVSNRGRVRRERIGGKTYAGRALSLVATNALYFNVSLCKPRTPQMCRYVHQLVAAAFIGPCPDGFEINHKDGNRQNNAPSNLEYVTHSENMRHATHVTGTCKPPFVVEGRHPMARLTAEQVIDIRRLAPTLTYREIGIRYGVQRDTIKDIVLRRKWKSVA